jgi:hypothetical protein
MLIWIIGILPTFMLFSYLMGKADKRFDMDQTIIENPPYIIGVMGCWAWPVIAAAAGMWLLFHVSNRKGRDEGLALNQELHELRKVAGELSKTEQGILKMLTDHNVDPDNITDNTMRALTARSIEFAMQEDIAARRKRVGLAIPDRPLKMQDLEEALDMEPVEDPKVTAMMEILDRNGHPIPTTLRKKGELEI